MTGPKYFLILDDEESIRQSIAAYNVLCEALKEQYDRENR